MKLTEKHTFNISKNQKKTLKLMDEKYSINVSEFIRQAINEKLNREKESILKHYKDVKKLIDEFNDCPF